MERFLTVRHHNVKLNTPYWARDDPEMMLTTIESVKKDFKNYAKICFVQNVLIYEGIDNVSLRDIEDIFSGTTFCLQNHDEYPKLYKKIRNLFKALQYVQLDTDLTRDNILQIRAIVFRDLSDVPTSVYRSVDIRPFESDLRYSDYEDIPFELKKLVKFTNAELEDTKTLAEFIKLAAFFYSEFLLIHPFVSGNTLVARILMQQLAYKKHIRFPLLFYYHNKYKLRLYTDALETRGLGARSSELATMLLHGTYHACCFIQDNSVDLSTMFTSSDEIPTCD
jgi:fido (protein-threonine AMPylation protein)